MDTEEKLIKLVAEVATPFWAGIIGGHLAESGVIIPVLCRDCKHYDDGYCSNYQWWDDDRYTDVNEDDFCSYGERKDNG